MNSVLGNDFDPRLLDLISTPEAEQCILDVAKANVKLDCFGLVVPTGGIRDLEARIVKTMEEARQRIQHVVLEGKTVVYFPGAFDLVHAGHVTFFLQGVDLFLKKHSKLKREDLFVVVLADSDDLVEAAKPAHLYATEGEHPRPIQGAKVFSHVLRNYTKANPRLLDLASLGVDMVGLLPSPAEMYPLLDNWFFQRWLNDHGEFQNDAIEVVADGTDDLSIQARTALSEYLEIVRAIKEGHFERVQASFEQVKFNLPTTDGKTYWTLPAWQLLLNRYLGFVHQFPNAGCYRVISSRDGYGGFVRRLMELSRIRHAPIDDVSVISTTTLLSTFGWETLYKAKVASLTELCSQ